MIDKKDPTVHTVYVSIATTTNKTMTASQRTGLVNQVDEVGGRPTKFIDPKFKSGLVPPVGGRVITVGETGQTAVVGFGSAIIAKADDRLTRGSEHKVDAQKRR